ncbi:hypothetical protein KY285_023695 [Solanum tuberosum]|nr:hypothetical protein KY285_023695 [Solanum tuberosum]
MEYYAGIAKYDIINFFASLSFLEHVQLNSSILKVADDYTRAEIPTLECLEVEGFSNMTFKHLSEVKLQGSLGTKPARQLVKLLLAKSRVRLASPKAKVVHNVDWDP